MSFPEKQSQGSSNADDPIFRATERFVLDSGSPVPLYHQMEQILLDRITKDDSVGRLLPSEKELTVVFGVSRATVKKTFNNLVAKGLVERRRALGTRVISQGITEDLAKLTSYTEEMRKKGLSTSTEVLDVKVIVPEPVIAQKLQLKPKEEVISVHRLRGTSEFFPIVLLHSQFPANLGIDPSEDFSGSLYEILEQSHNILIQWGQEEIRAADATDEQAKLLGISPGDAVLIMERITYSHGNRPVEFVRGIYRSEHFKYSIRLKR